MKRNKTDFPFRYAERCLYEYKANASRLKILREKLAELDASMSVHGQNYEPLAGGGEGNSSPVAIRALKITSLEDEIATLEIRTTPITNLINDLSGEEVLSSSRNAELMQIMKLFYFGQNPAEAVANKLRISRAKFYRRREQTVKLAIKYLGI